MIQTRQSSAANYLAPITSGHGDAYSKVAAHSSEFAQLLGNVSGRSVRLTEPSTGTLSESMSLDSLSRTQWPTIHQASGESAAEQETDWRRENESTLNGKLPEQEPETAQEALTQFVGETFYGMMIKQMRSSVIKSDLMGNSNAEKMFESQFDQMMVERLAENSSDSLAKPMYQQMMRNSQPQ